MGFSRLWKGAGLVAVGLLVGYLIGPSIAQAAASLVRIQSCCSLKTAKVNARNQVEVHTDASTSSVFAFTEPSGETVLLSRGVTASDDQSKTTGPYNDIVGVSVDVSVAGASPVTLTLRKGSTQGVGAVIWQGTIQTDGHLDWSAPNAIFVSPGAGKGFNVHLENAGGATVQYEVYGFGFTVPCCVGQHGLERR
jgi:hypothetical protein